MKFDWKSDRAGLVCNMLNAQYSVYSRGGKWYGGYHHPPHSNFEVLVYGCNSKDDARKDMERIMGVILLEVRLSPPIPVR